MAIKVIIHSTPPAFDFRRTILKVLTARVLTLAENRRGPAKVTSAGGIQRKDKICLTAAIGPRSKSQAVCGIERALRLSARWGFRGFREDLGCKGIGACPTEIWRGCAVGPVPPRLFMTAVKKFVPPPSDALAGVLGNDSIV